jgi:hypothetical protein
MAPDLMGTAGDGRSLDQTHIPGSCNPSSRDRTEMRLRGFFSHIPVGPEGRRSTTVNECHVALLDMACGKSLAHQSDRIRMLSKHHPTAGGKVQSMASGYRFSIGAPDQRTDTMQQRASVISRRQ